MVRDPSQRIRPLSSLLPPRNSAKMKSRSAESTFRRPGLPRSIATLPESRWRDHIPCKRINSAASNKRLLFCLTWFGFVMLFRLGIVNLDIAVDGKEEEIFRLTRGGAALLGLCDPPDIQISADISIDAGAIIDVPARRRYERYQLSRIAQFVDRDNIHRFRLTPRSLKRAKQQHIPVNTYCGFSRTSDKKTFARQSHDSFGEYLSRSIKGLVWQVNGC